MSHLCEPTPPQGMETVLDLLRAWGPVNCPDIARRMQLRGIPMSLSHVYTVTERLVNEGKVCRHPGEGRGGPPLYKVVS